MAEKKNESSFTVTDRRKFTIDGEVRPDAPREEENTASTSTATTTEPKPTEFPKRQVEAPKPEAPAESAVAEPEEEDPITADERRASAAAYKQSSDSID